LQCSPDGFSMIRSPAAWQITQRPTYGFQVGFVWGPLRRPFSWSNSNPWTERADWTLRFPWVVLPWFHIWLWRTHGGVPADHPARFYIGGKLFYAHTRPGEDVWRDERLDPSGWYVAPSVSFRRG